MLSARSVIEAAHCTPRNNEREQTVIYAETNRWSGIFGVSDCWPDGNAFLSRARKYRQVYGSKNAVGNGSWSESRAARRFSRAANPTLSAPAFEPRFRAAGCLRVSVVNQRYDPEVQCPGGFLGNNVLMRCNVPSFVRDHVTITSWLQEPSFNIYPSTMGDGKYHMLSSGELMILNITREDAERTYRCRTHHRLTQETVVSNNIGRLQLTEIRSSMPPMINEKVVYMSARLKDTIVIPCVAYGNPTPTNRGARECTDASRRYRGYGKVTAAGRYIDARSVWVVQTNRPLITETASDSPSNIPHLRALLRLFRCLFRGSTESSAEGTQPYGGGKREKEKAAKDKQKDQREIARVEGGGWYYNRNQREESVEDSSGHYVVRDGSLVIQGVQETDAGSYMCTASNSEGSESMEVKLTVSAPLSVHVQPSIQTVDLGKAAHLTCSASGFPQAALYWLKDGQPLRTGARIRAVTRERISVMSVAREDRGMYQCFVRNEYEMAQGIAELRLGEIAPQLVYRFIEQTMQTGPSVSLKCSAAGNPTPQISWLLDGFPLPQNDRLLIGQYVTVYGDVISHVNISSVKFAICQAHVDGFGGRWETVPHQMPGRWLPHRIDRLGERRVLIYVLLSTAKRSFYFEVTYRDGSRLRDKLIGHVVARRVPPKITPFSFARDLNVGDRTSVQCVVVTGDLPLTFTWLKDNGEQSPRKAITVRQYDAFTSALSISTIAPAHNGTYTCRVANDAATVAHSALLHVNGKRTPLVYFFVHAPTPTEDSGVSTRCRFPSHQRAKVPGSFPAVFLEVKIRPVTDTDTCAPARYADHPRPEVTRNARFPRIDPEQQSPSASGAAARDSPNVIKTDWQFSRPADYVLAPGK
ncbi:Down syndrome cell adhesion molecule-like protein Dscam2 [Eufriesea mexicana]|nr:Down syndrome cell adhesion molecule-like protein Dscam2 [Eufriesea mexicana]